MHWRMAVALRDLSAIGNLRAGAATLSGVGSITEDGDTVEARGSVTADDNADRSAQSALVMWWREQSFEVQVFLMMLFWILQMGLGRSSPKESKHGCIPVTTKNARLSTIRSPKTLAQKPRGDCDV